MEEISLKAELTDEEMRSIFGMRDAYIKKVESSMDVRVVSRNGYLYVYGSKDNAEKAMSVIMDLKDYRAAIDGIDRELLALFTRRLALCSDIAVWKKEHGLPALDEVREKEKLAAVGFIYDAARNRFA